jgi:phosphoribosyl-AMP cyclohydrolase
VVLVVAALVASACSGESEDTDQPQVGIADSEAGSGPDSGSATGQGSADSAASGPAEGQEPADPIPADDPDAKTLAAVAISDLPAAEEAPGGSADEAEAVFDEVNKGKIEVELGIDRWTFEAQEGQLLAIDVLSIDHDCNQDLELVLVTPDGHRADGGWVGNGGCHVHGPFELDQSGRYAIELIGGDGGIIPNKTGAYRFTPTMLTEHDVAPLVFGEPNEGKISELFGVDRWTFDAEAGAQLTINVLSIDHDCNQDLALILEDPFGVREPLSWVGNGGCHAHGPIELGPAGAYVLEFAGGAGDIIKHQIGGYRFVPGFVTERDEEAVVLDQPLKGEISQLFGADRWTIDASKGDSLTIEVINIGDDCRQDVALILEDPFGVREPLSWVGNNRCKVHGPYVLERDGTHVIEFVGGKGDIIDDTTGPYTFLVSLS